MLAESTLMDRHCLADVDLLILEDEAIIALEMSLDFEDAGARVQIAGTLADAERILSVMTPHVAVLDVNLGGGKTCLPIADELRRRGIPFLLHTGNLDRHNELVRTIGARVLSKPTSTGRLIYEIERLVH